MDVTIQHPWYRRPWFLGFFPHKMYDPYFGELLHDSDLLSPYSSMFFYRPYFWHFPNWFDSGTSEVKMERDHFVIKLDVKHFSPEDLRVKVNEDYVEISGNHEEPKEKHGYMAREFYRKFKIPASVDPGSFTGSLSSDGMLTVCAHRHQDNPERNITITSGEKPPLEK